MGTGDYFIGIAVGVACGLINGVSLYKNFSDSVIPNTSEVQQGYVAPSEIEIKCQDLDNNGIDETIMKVGEKSYLLRDVNGKPTLSEYSITPAKIIPQK